MNILKAKRIRHFLRLSYPVRMVARDVGFSGDYPDLPGCAVAGGNLDALYQQLEVRRRAWITEQVLLGANVPVPNSHLSTEAETNGGPTGADKDKADKLPPAQIDV